MARCAKEQKAFGHDTLFKAVLIYENVVTGARAQCCLEGSARASGKTLQEQTWNFEVLGIREARNGAASAARKADVVALSASGQLELPDTVRAWFDIWLWLLKDEKPALLDSSATPAVVSINAYLSRIAQRAGIEFFSAHPQVSLFPVVRPKEEAIWPESVDRAMISRLESFGSKFRPGYAAPPLLFRSPATGPSLPVENWRRLT